MEGNSSFSKCLILLIPNQQLHLPVDWMHERHPCLSPLGGEAVQIGCPADLSGNPCRNDLPPTLVYNC